MDALNSSPSSRPSLLARLIRKVGVNTLTMVVALLVIITLVLVFKGRDLAHAYHSHAAERAATEAMKLIKAERWGAASTLLQDSFRRHPDQPALLRAVAELSAHGNSDPQTAIAYLRRVLSMPEATHADRRRMAEVLLQSGDPAEARRLYQELPASEQNSRPGLELLASITRLSGNVTEADDILRRALTLDPNDKECRLRLAIMDETGALEAAKQTRAAIIWEIASQKDEVAELALVHLATRTTLTATQARELKALAEQHPQLPERDRYQVLRAFLRLNPLEHDRTVQAEIARTKARNVEDKFDFLRWLGTSGDYQKVLDIVPAEAITRDPDVFRIYVDALSAAERWKELLNLMQTRKAPLSAGNVHIILATCYAKLQPDLKQARSELVAALSGGHVEMEVLVRAAGLSESLNMFDLAVQAYKAFAEASPPRRNGVLEKVLELQRGDRDVEGMMGTLKQLHDLRPRNRGYTDQLNYLRLIMGREMEIAFEEIIGFESPAPSEAESPQVPTALLRSLAAYRLGDQQRMAEETARLPDPTNLGPGLRAVIAGLYNLCGNDVAGFRLGEKVPATTLLEGELAFLRRGMR